MDPFRLFLLVRTEPTAKAKSLARNQRRKVKATAYVITQSGGTETRLLPEEGSEKSLEAFTWEVRVPEDET